VLHRPELSRKLQQAAGGTSLRVASFNVRVDHHEDLGTVHAWPERRSLVASTLVGLHADVVGLQEPSPLQAADLQRLMGDEWGVVVEACDHEAWAQSLRAGTSHGPEGQTRDGNGFAWRHDRLELIEMDSIDIPSRSPFQRTCVLGRFRDRSTSQLISVFSAHFDHEGGDESGDGAEARRQSAVLVMERAKASLSHGVSAVFVLGDFNTFQDRHGDCYAALKQAGAGLFSDVRDIGEEVECGRGDSTWEGWESNAWSRSKKGDQRYDQCFVSSGVQVLRTCVPNERFVTTAHQRAIFQAPPHVYASVSQIVSHNAVISWTHRLAWMMYRWCHCD
jgi:endonuclease/exonuclease/phosphatase family metal-dependent hydrolase